MWDAWRTRLVMESLLCCNPMRKSSWTTKAPVNRHLISSMTTTTSSMWAESFWGKSKLGPDMCSDPTWCFKLAKPGENHSWLSKREIVDCENKGWLLGFLMTLSCPPTLQPVVWYVVFAQEPVWWNSCRRRGCHQKDQGWDWGPM